MLPPRSKHKPVHPDWLSWRACQSARRRAAAAYFRRRGGVEGDDLRALYALCKAEGDTRLWCAVMVATYGLLRSESYTLSQVYRSSRVCRIGDIIATEEGMCLSLFGIKGQPGTAFDVQLARTGGWACVVTAIERHLRRAEPTTFLLESSPGIPWGYHQFLGALKRACGLVGLDPKSIGTHSLRRTGAQLLERLKIVPESAKPKMGRWKPRSKVYVQKIHQATQ